MNLLIGVWLFTWGDRSDQTAMTVLAVALILLLPIVTSLSALVFAAKRRHGKMWMAALLTSVSFVIGGYFFPGILLVLLGALTCQLSGPREPIRLTETG